MADIKTETKDAALFGVEIEVERFVNTPEGGLRGRPETVKVRQVKLSEYRTALRFAGDEMKFTAMVCDKPPGWIETLSPDSYDKLAIEATRINERFFAYCDRQVNAGLKMLPDKVVKQIMSGTGPT